MAIFQIEDVKINGRNQAFGGFIYAVDYDVGLLDRPSTVTVTFISENGRYLEPELSVTKPYRIQIGNIVNENFYAVTRVLKKSSRGRELEVTFLDGSILLDRLYVGLYKRMGDENTNVPGLIIVGREIHPCDVNEDGQFDQEDVETLKWQSLDPCELKCPSDADATEPVVEECIKRETVELFDVKYSFDELIDAITGVTTVSPQPREITYPVEADLNPGSVDVTITLPAVGIAKNTSKSNQVKVNVRPRVTNEHYLASYSGTLREVLRNWCSDFGWSFYWESDGLTFIDTKERPKIRDFGFTNIDSINDTRTLEGTVSRGFVSHYAQAGIEAQKDCSQSRPLMLRCLTLRDLYGSYYKPAWNASAYNQGDYSSVGPSTVLSPPIPDPANSSPDNQIEYRDDISSEGVAIENFEVSCVLAYYSDTLRHLYNLWQYYGIRSATDAENMKGRWLDRLGQMNIVSVFSANSTGDNLRKFQDLTTTQTKDQNGKTALSQEEVEHLKKFNGYIVIALRNRKGLREDMLDKQFRLEENLASEFIGQHWYRAYIAPHQGDTPDIFPNGQYFGALSTNVKDLPFANFHHTHRSNISKMISSFIQRQRNDYRQFGNLRYASTTVQQGVSTNISKKLVRSIIYFNRNTSESWLPLKNPETQLSSLISELENYMFRSRSLEDFSTEEIRALVTENGTSLVQPEFFGNLEMFIFYPQLPSGFAVTSEITENPNTEHPQHTEGLEPFSLATAGLLSNDCAKYAINGTPIFTPAGGSVLFQTESDTFRWSLRQPTQADFDSPSYKVYVTSSTSNRGIIPKTESTFILPANPNSALKVEYQVKDVTRDSLQLLNKLTNACQLSPEEIKAIHELWARNLNYNITNPFNSKQYRLMGVTIPSRLTIRDGLESVKVRVGDDGVFTDVTIGDSLFTPPSPDYILRTLELGLNSRIANLRKNPL